MGRRPTGSAAILFCCICVVVALYSSSMAVVASAAPEKPMVVVASAVPKQKPMAVAASTAPKEKPKFISMGALACSANITKKAAASPARKLVGVHGHVSVDIPGVCPVRFDHTRGISAVALSCRERPVISPERCCGALRTFACPYSDYLNDNANNGCATDMFFQIIVRGRLRPGLFSQMCVDGPLGLNC